MKKLLILSLSIMFAMLGTAFILPYVKEVQSLPDNMIITYEDIEKANDFMRNNVTDTEFRTQLTAIAESGAEFLFAPYYYSVVGPNLIPQAREVGYDGVIVGPDGYDGTENYTAGSPEDYENVYYTNHYSSEDDSEKVQKFVKAYEDKYDKESLNGLSALSYDAMYMLADAIEKAGSTDRKKIRDAMSGMEFEGVTGHFTLDKTGTPSKSVVVMGFFVEGDKVVEKFVETLK